MSLPTIAEPSTVASEGEVLESDLREFLSKIVDSFVKWSAAKRSKDIDDLVNYCEETLSIYTVQAFYQRFSKDEEHGLDIDKMQILPCERQIKLKLVKFFVYGEPGLWRESIAPTIVSPRTNPILKSHQEEPYTYSVKSYLKGPFAIVRTAIDQSGNRVALKEYSPEIDVSYDILIQNLMLNHPNGLRPLCTYRTTRTGRIVQKMAMEPWCDYRLEDVISARAYGFDLVLRVAYCLGSLLYHIHCHGVKHVNINPRNILLTEEGGIFLGDLSSSRMYVEEEDENDGSFTPSLTTPGGSYMALNPFSFANATSQAQTPTASVMSQDDAPTERGRLKHPSAPHSVSTLANLTIQTDLFYTSPEQKVDVSRRGTDIWMLGVTLLEMLYYLSDPESQKDIRAPEEFGYMVAALPTNQVCKKLRSLPQLEDEKEEKIRQKLVDILEEVLVQQPMHRPSAYSIHQRLAAYARFLEYPLEENPDPDLPPIERAKDIIRSKIPYSVHEHTTIKGEDDHYVDLSRGEKKVRFGNDFQTKVFEGVEEGDEEGNELSPEEQDRRRKMAEEEGEMLRRGDDEGWLDMES